MPVPHHGAQAKVTFLQRSQAHQNSHFFVVTCHFSPVMEKLISFPCIPPYWEWSSSFPLRGRVLLPFFTGWTSANENHYWTHSMYLSGDILGEGKFLSQDIASQMLNLKFRGKMKWKCWLSPAEIGAFLRPDSVSSRAISITWAVPSIFAQMSLCRNTQIKDEAFATAFHQSHYPDFFPFLLELMFIPNLTSSITISTSYLDEFWCENPDCSQL